MTDALQSAAVATAGEQRSAAQTWLPQAATSAHYSLQVRASQSAVWQALLETNLLDLRLSNILMTLRSFGRQRNTCAFDRQGFAGALEQGGFILLEQQEPHTIVFGLVGQFWKPTGGVIKLPASDFAAFTQPGFAKAAWSVDLIAAGGHATLLTTETRVQCFGGAASALFRCYWSAIAPFSGLIRKELLRDVCRRAEGLQA